MENGVRSEERETLAMVSPMKARESGMTYQSASGGSWPDKKAAEYPKRYRYYTRKQPI